MSSRENQALLKIENLHTNFYTKAGVVHAVNGVDIEIPRGKIVALVGESGCGKSMTAMSIMGLVAQPGRVDEGRILFQGENLLNLSFRERRQMCGSKISIIFQEPMTSLNPVITVGKQVREVILLHESVNKEEARNRVIELFRQVGIPDPVKRYKNYPHQLSGGLRQRVMIAMAMACNPDLLIADEPTTALDVTIEAQILHLMRKLQKEHHTAILMITHNLGVVAELCDYVYVMYAGQVVEAAEVRELFRNPLHPYTDGLLRSLPGMQPDQIGNHSSDVIKPSLSRLPAGCSFSPRCDRCLDSCARQQPGLVRITENHYVRCFDTAGREGEA